jgi:hypothetical protein
MDWRRLLSPQASKGKRFLRDSINAGSVRERPGVSASVRLACDSLGLLILRRSLTGQLGSVDALHRPPQTGRSRIDLLADLIKRYGDRQPYAVAGFYAHRHDADKAFAWLDRAYSAHDWVWYIRSDPYFEPIRADPRYAQLIKKWGLTN